MKISELPEAIKKVALHRQKECKGVIYEKDTDYLMYAFDWAKTKEGQDFWENWYNKESILHLPLTDEEAGLCMPKEEPKHYDNSKGSLYQFCSDKELNTYEFDIIKRVMRCRKKGLFLEDLEKTKFLIDLYIKEQKQNNE